MQNHPYFIRDKVVVLAHRGFTPPTENTLAAFQNALDAGADYIETDTRSTLDGHAVLFHDEDLSRQTGSKIKVSQHTLAELRQHIAINTLDEALRAFPNARFNVDIKDNSAIQPTVKAIEDNNCHDRVLVSSFSNKRRLKALAELSQEVATSASGSIVIKVWVRTKLGLELPKLLTGIGALQIPISTYGMKFDSERFIKAVSDTGTLIHYWTINDASQMRRLVQLGAHGIVTDNTALAVVTLLESK